MSRLTQIVTAVLLSGAMAFSAAAQGRGGKQGNNGGEKQPRTIEREPKGDRGNNGGNNGGRNGQDRNAGNNGGGREGGREGGKGGRPNRPNDF